MFLAGPTVALGSAAEGDEGGGGADDGMMSTCAPPQRQRAGPTNPTSDYQRAGNGTWRYEDSGDANRQAGRCRWLVTSG